MKGIGFGILFGVTACGGGLEPCGMGMGRTDGGECAPLASEDSARPAETAEPQETAVETAEPEPTPDPVLSVYLLAGQSNMDGVGLVTGLPPSMQVASPDIPIFWSGRWAWQGLAPSSYMGVQYFGPEVTFGHRLLELDPEQPLALIKHAWGGTNLAQCWYPGESGSDPAMGDCYSDFMATVDTALSGLEERETPYRIAGMAWMQGESDATYEPWAESYELNLKQLIARVREDVQEPKMPLVMGRIDCSVHCSHRETVREAQDAVAASDLAVDVVETEDLPQVADGLHFDASGMRTLGERFADVLAGRGARATALAAVELSGTYRSDYTGNFVVGYAFETDRELVVTDLGTLDIGLDGLENAAVVAIWNESGSLLVQQLLPGRSSAATSRIDSWRYAAIEPYLLPKGRYIIGSQVYRQSPDRYIHHAEVAFSEGIRWVEGRHANGTALNFPSQVTSAEASWFGPSFLFEEVEEEKEVP